MSLVNITNRIRQLRGTNEYKKWRKDVLERDNGKCVLCGLNKNVEVDHIKPLALFPELALKIANGRVLCSKCHKKTDTYGSLSIFRGETPIHPILTGDFLYKIKSLPTSLDFRGKPFGFYLKFIPKENKWKAGYLKVNITGETIEGAIDGIFEALRQAASYTRDMELNKSLKEENQKLQRVIMNQSSTKYIRHELYAYIEKLLGRELFGNEIAEIKNLFIKAVEKYHLDKFEKNKE